VAQETQPQPWPSLYGVDINRNYDFLWSATIGNTSSDSCSGVFHGPAAFSEPETRNVRWMLDSFPNVRAMMDVHSYAQLVLYPWGDNELQTTDPSRNFINAAYVGLRGNVDDSLYQEYMPADCNWFANTGDKVRDAIAAVNGNVYTVKEAVYLYPTSGTSKDYAHSRPFVAASKPKVSAYTLETGTESQPTFPAAADLMKEIMSGLVQFRLQSLCVTEEVAEGTDVADRLPGLRAFRDQELLATGAGWRWVSLLERHTGDFLQVVVADPNLREAVVDVLRWVSSIVDSRHGPDPKAFDDEVIRDVEHLTDRVEGHAGPGLKEALNEGRAGLGGSGVRRSARLSGHKGTRSPWPRAD